MINFPLYELLLPLDNMTRGAYKQSYKNILQALNNDKAIIIFPAGEVSRASPKGIRDGKWQAGFLHFARKTKAPILPIFVSAKNSLLFYSASMIFKPLATALLAHEMFNKHSAEIKFRIGEVIPHHALETDKLADKALIKRLKKHLYKIGKNRSVKDQRPAIFITEKTIAHPEDRAALIKEFKTAESIGKTRDNHGIYLCDYNHHPTVLREIGLDPQTVFEWPEHDQPRVRRDVERARRALAAQYGKVIEAWLRDAGGDPQAFVVELLVAVEHQRNVRTWASASPVHLEELNP